MKFEGGLYNDDGTKVDEELIPFPNLCVVCKKHMIDNYMENILCKMNTYGIKNQLIPLKSHQWKKEYTCY